MTIYYQDERVTLHHGKAEDVLPTLPPMSIHVAITDPPYSAKVHGSARSRRMVSANATAGSGTTLVAAKRAGRYGIGVEEDERTCEVAAQRLQAVGASLFDVVRDDTQDALIDDEVSA